MTSRSLRQRVVEACEAALGERRAVAAVDVLVGVGWVHPVNVEAWRRGRLATLDELVPVPPETVLAALRLAEQWAGEQGLRPVEAPYLSGDRQHSPLRFTADGDEEIERLGRLHWTSPELTDSGQGRLVDKRVKPPEVVVIDALRHWTCGECGGTGDLLHLEGDAPLCLECADLGHLVFLPAGDAALTRRARKASALSAVVLRFSRSRKRYERQGLLVEEPALEQAEEQCLADAEVRARRRERDVQRRGEQDTAFQDAFAAQIRQLFPGCPAARAEAVARHAGARGSGRVGRTAAGQALDARAVEAALRASVRHEDTGYDRLLMDGVDRARARGAVLPKVQTVLDRWRTP